MVGFLLNLKFHIVILYSKNEIYKAKYEVEFKWLADWSVVYRAFV